MIKYSIYFHNTEEVAEFVKLANHFPCDVDLISGNRMVDGKSLMGAIAISQAPELCAVIHSDSNNADRLSDELASFSHSDFVA